MKYFVTKYALTKGIIEFDGEITDTCETMIHDGNRSITTYHKPFWHETYEAACHHAELLRTNKLKSIDKQIKKLKSLRFE